MKIFFRPAHAQTHPAQANLQPILTLYPVSSPAFLDLGVILRRANLQSYE
jgi:hypothetical protein